jgi:hypothetical protein
MRVDAQLRPLAGTEDHHELDLGRARHLGGIPQFSC